MKYKYINLIAFILLAAVNGYAQNNLWIDTVSAGTNQVVEFNINVSNSLPFTAVQLDIQLPSSLTYADSSAVLYNGRKADQVLSAGLVNGNTLRLLAYSGSLTAFNGNSGTVISFKCRTGTQAGNYTLTIINPLLGNAAGKNILTNYFNGLFTLLASRIQLDKSSLNFGRIPLGQYSDIDVTITNTGTSQLNITKLTTNNSEIRFVDSSAVIISPGNNIIRAIRFAPLTKGSKNVLLEIISNDPSDSVYNISAAGIGYTINEIHIGNINARSGYEASLSVSINNMEAFTAFEFTLQLPAVMKYEFGSGVLTGRIADQVLSVDTLSNNQLKIIAYSPTNTNFAGTSGDILQLKFQISGSAGSYPLQISNPIISTNKGENVLSASYNGMLNIISPRIYTANSNINLGKVSVKDTSTYLLNVSNAGNDTLTIYGYKINNNKFWTGESFPQILPPNNSINVKINYHSPVEGADSAALQLFSNDAVTNPLVMNFSAASYSPNILFVKSGSLFENEKGTISVSLSNLKKAAGVQLDITIPKEFSVNKDSIYLSNRKADQVIISAAVNDTTYRIISYSPSLKPFSDTAGIILSIPVTTGNILNDYPVTISNAVLSDSTGKNILTSEFSGTISIISKNIIIASNNNAGWNLVSLPTNVSNGFIANIFHLAIGYAFSFITKYDVEDTLHAGKGYWLKFSGQSADNISGLPVQSDTINIQQGWNLIGSISDSVNIDSIVVNPLGNLSSNFFGYNMGYKIANYIIPSKAYWIKAYNAGSMTLSSNKNYYPNLQLNKNRKALNLAVIDTSILDTINVIKIMDAANNNQDLYFGRAKIDLTKLSYFELPPKPPIGAFDARFSSDMFAEILPDTIKDSVSYEIDIQSSNYPISVSGKIKQSGFIYSLYELKNNAFILLANLTGSFAFIINDSLVKELILTIKPNISGTENTPNFLSEYNLYQNYPNPFNPSTEISYQLGSPGYVTLKIYNLLGQQIADLVNNESQSVGKHQISFNAGKYNLSSGIYFIELIAEDAKSSVIKYNHIIKMLYLK